MKCFAEQLRPLLGFLGFFGVSRVLGFRVGVVGFRVQGFGVYGLRFLGFWGFGFRVSGMKIWHFGRRAV